MLRAAVILIAFALHGCVSQEQREVRDMQAAPWLVAESAANKESYIVVTVRNPRVADVQAASTGRDYNTAQPYGPSPRARSDVKKLASRYALRLVNAWPIEILGVHCVVYAVPPTVKSETIIARMQADRLVESVQQLNSFATLASGASAQPPKQYNDPYFNLQSNLQVLQVPQAQRFSRGAGVRIAIIDTGIDAKHPDLAGRVWVQRNFVGGPSGATPERHGTAVAGVIAALDDNNVGIVGIAPAAQLLALRACWPVAVNDARSLCNTFTLAQALSAAIELRADVVNLSLGGPGDPLLNRLVAAGMQHGIVYVGAVNSNSRTQNTFPGGVPGVISVDNAEIARAQRGNTLSLFAPGSGILTLTPSGGYDFMSGSSLAAASVTGGVALLLARRHSTQRNELYSALAKSLRTDSVDLCMAISALDPRASCSQL